MATVGSPCRRRDICITPDSPNEQAGQAVDPHLQAIDRDAARARRRFVRADGEHAAAEDGVAQHQRRQRPRAARVSQTPGATMSQSGCGNVTASSLTHVGGTFTVCWSAIHLATPRAMPSVPSVAMNGMTFRRVIEQAVDRRRRARRRARRPAPPAAGSTPSRRAIAVTTPVSAIADPTDRSMPAADDDHRHADRAERDDHRLRDDDAEVADGEVLVRRVGQQREDGDDREQAEERPEPREPACAGRR